MQSNEKVSVIKSRHVRFNNLIHPGGTSKDSDICDLSKVSDIVTLSRRSMRIIFFFTTKFISHRYPISVNIYKKIYDPDIYGFLCH